MADIIYWLMSFWIRRHLADRRVVADINVSLLTLRGCHLELRLFEQTIPIDLLLVGVVHLINANVILACRSIV